MNLTQIKREVFHDTMDLYVINASNMVEFTTYPPDQDLDFNSEPDFAEYLDGIRNTSGFYPDRVVREPETNILRKYAYAPTPDHLHILELGMIGDTFRSERQRLMYTSTIKDIKTLNPYVEDVRLFTQFKKQVGNSSFKPDPMLKARLDQVIENKTGFDWTCPKTGNKIRYKYINLKDEDYGSDLSMVAELTYSSAPLTAALSDLVNFHALAALAALLVGLVTAGIVSGRLTDPIRGLVGDVNEIAKGDLDHPISPSPAREFTILATSISAMVGRLKGTIEQTPAARAEPLRERGPLPPHARPGLGLRLLQAPRGRRNLDHSLVGRYPGEGLPVHVRPARRARRVGGDRPRRRPRSAPAAHGGRARQQAS